MEGKGTIVYPGGELFEGLFRNGRSNGPGVMQYSDGSILSINFVNGKKEGEGQYRKANGVKYILYYEDDVMVEQQTEQEWKEEQVFKL
jgi:hypothetical protein